MKECFPFSRCFLITLSAGLFVAASLSGCALIEGLMGTVDDDDDDPVTASDAGLDASSDADDDSDAGLDASSDADDDLCPAEPQQHCDDVCVDVTEDDEHCGDCHESCDDGQTCDDGSCVDCIDDADCGSGDVGSCDDGECACPYGYLNCGGECVDVTANDQHCGNCNVDCGSDHSCHFGECEQHLVLCDSSDDCLGDLVCDHFGRCSNTDCSDNDQCCSSIDDCPEGTYCPSGACVECLEQTHCHTDELCDSGDCEACSDWWGERCPNPQDDCGSGQQFLFRTGCYVPDCSDNTDCDTQDGRYCNPHGLCTISACEDDGDCPSGSTCSQHRCT